jgi:hypothetical protein
VNVVRTHDNIDIRRALTHLVFVFLSQATRNHDLALAAQLNALLFPRLKPSKAETTQPPSHPKLNHELKSLSQQWLGQSTTIKSNAYLSKILSSSFLGTASLGLKHRFSAHHICDLSA